MTRWSRETIVAALQRWRAEVGDAPSCEDWEARKGHPHWLRNRGDFPTQQTVRNHFGSWTAAVEAAGMIPRPVGHPGGACSGDRRDRPAAVRERLRARKAALEAELADVERELKAA